MQEKVALRKKYRELRAQLSASEIDNKSLEIANQLLKLKIWDKKYYHLYFSIKRLFEIQTEYIFQILMGKDKEIVISKSDFETASMQHFLLTDNTKIKINAWGIPEPENGLMVPVEMIDVVFVPVLAYDIQGNRVGYGKGFYDRFLSDCRPDVLKIGLSFYEPECEIIISNSEDVKLDLVVTDQSVFWFGK
jgi:5-formyltetrahydrofolate cyclo-ligase